MMRPFRASGPRSDTTSMLLDSHESDSLSGELLALGGPTTDERPVDVSSKKAGEAPTTGDGTVVDGDDVDLDADEDLADDVDPWPCEETYGSGGERRPTRLTRLLVAALLFVLGALAGVWVDRTLAPEPQPRVVYLLNG